MILSILQKSGFAGLAFYSPVLMPRACLAISLERSIDEVILVNCEGIET